MMSIEFTGMIGHQLSSEILPPTGPIFDRDHIVRFAQTHEAAGFDRILVGHWSDRPDGFLVTALAGLSTKRIRFLLAHRPGFVSPTLAARKFATLEHLLEGRLAVHIISGGSNSEQRRDGDWLDHDERYARSDAFLEVVRRTWTSEEPFDIANDFYRAEQARSAIRPQQQPHIPIWFGGSSDAALRVAGRHADVFALWGESLDQTRDTIQRVREEAAKEGRQPRFSVSFRPIIADTEEAAWAKANEILERARELASGYTFSPKPESVGAQRLRETAAKGDIVDKRLWTGIARLVGGGHNSTALVGTPEQVADALLDYYDLGVSHFLIRGFDPVNDARDYGQALIPLTREKVRLRAEARRQPA
jgi:alkanesulfonate monooxygenase